MRVLHLLKTSDGAKWALRLMKQLVDHGIEVHVALPLNGTLIPEYHRLNIQTHSFNCSLLHLHDSITQLRRIVEDVKPDIIHSHFVITTMIMRLGLRKCNIPRIFEVPGPLHLEHKLTRWIDVITAQDNDYWIPTCKWSYDRYVKSGVPQEKLFLTYYGTDINQANYKSGFLRTKYNIPSDKFIVAMVAFMYPPKKWLGQKRGIKGHEDFIDALALIQDEYPNIQGICIGGAWNGAVKYEHSIHQYAKAKNVNVIFTGTLHNIGECYQDIDCVVHPSHSENLGGAGESLLLGVPTIATAVGGFPDIVINEQTGLLIPPHSPQDIAEAIVQMYNNPLQAKEMANCGKKHVSNILNVVNTSNQIVDFYRQLLNK